MSRQQAGSQKKAASRSSDSASALENVSIAELRAVYAKDAIRLVQRARQELPRAGYDYVVVRFSSTLFSSPDFTGAYFVLQ
jgi:hypothetical protein